MSNNSNFNLQGILKIIGALVVIEGLFMLLALPFSYYYQDGSLESILISSLITLTSGGILYSSMRKSRSKNLGKREGYIIVSFSWLIISLFGTLPYLISGTIPTFTNAFFIFHQFMAIAARNCFFELEPGVPLPDRFRIICVHQVI